MSKYIYGLTVSTSSVATYLALQTLQNGNDCIFHFHKAMAVQVIQPHKIRKVQAAGRYQFDQCTETHGKLVNKDNFED